MTAKQLDGASVEKNKYSILKQSVAENHDQHQGKEARKRDKRDNCWCLMMPS